METRYLSLILFLFFSSASFCQADLLKPQGIYTSNFVIDQIPRTITYYTPVSYGKQETYPLLIFLPDDKSNAKSIIKKYGDLIHGKADSLNCVVMYPDAVAGHWNNKWKSDPKDSTNDAGFISIMLDYFVQQYHCDADRIYLLGIGNGGAMCYRFSCESNSQPAAFATVSAPADTSNMPPCRIKKAVPAIRIRQEGEMQPAIEKALTFLFAQHKN